jgi:hypothetical protein
MVSVSAIVGGAMRHGRLLFASGTGAPAADAGRFVRLWQVAQSPAVIGRPWI